MKLIIMLALAMELCATGPSVKKDDEKQEKKWGVCWSNHTTPVYAYPCKK